MCYESLLGRPRVPAPYVALGSPPLAALLRAMIPMGQISRTGAPCPGYDTARTPLTWFVDPGNRIPVADWPLWRDFLQRMADLSRV